MIDRGLPDKGQWMPKYSWTKMFRNPTMSGHGTELCRALVSGVSRATASPMTMSFLGHGVAKSLVNKERGLRPAANCFRNPVQGFQISLSRC